ncbi:MAG: hypothetical protein JOZ78_17780 [Chroococcidiopsidaceae cyanobacterium CP_BM_ER_R8_30]|nr:hypothetical protein [Chroococcidiopsidaceae cyanobacterium CP_BM_ER_R8_30]
MNNCPCCTGNLLRHVRSSKIYWFCPNCWQEMPNLTSATQGFAGDGSGTADKGEAFSIAPGGRLRADDKACGRPAGNVLENGGVDAIDPNRLNFLKQAKSNKELVIKVTAT